MTTTPTEQRKAISVCNLSDEVLLTRFSASSGQMKCGIRGISQHQEECCCGSQHAHIKHDRDQGHFTRFTVVYSTNALCAYRSRVQPQIIHDSAVQSCAAAVGADRHSSLCTLHGKAVDHRYYERLAHGIANTLALRKMIGCTTEDTRSSVPKIWSR